MNVFTKLFSYFYARYMRSVERKVGYRLEFGNVPEVWIDGWMVFDMEKSWKKWGIQASGVNYFTMGALSGDVSSRFLRTEKQYQSWLGAYLVKFEEDREFTLEDHRNLAVADQKNWLEDFGDPDPFMQAVRDDYREAGVIMAGEYEVQLYETHAERSHSDVGENSRNLRNKVLMSLMASMFNAKNDRLNLNGSNFLPRDLSPNYEVVTLKGFAGIIDLEENVKVVLYGNGAAILGDQEIDYYPLLKEDILEAFRNVVITKV